MSAAGLQRDLNAVPVVVGVIGGDVPEDAEAALGAQFGAILDHLAQTYRFSPLLVLSARDTPGDTLASKEAERRHIAVMACPAVPDTAAFIVYYSAVVVTFDGGKKVQTPHGAPVFQISQSGVREFYADPGGMPGAGTKKKAPVRRRQRGKPVDEGRDAFEMRLRNLDRFNADIAREPAPKADDALKAFQVRADGASNRLQKWTLHSLRGLYTVAAIAGAVQLIVQPPVTDLLHGALGGAGAGIRVAVLAIAFLWFKYAKREDYENRYQDYRAIAEALRVQHAWCRAGMRDRLVENSYLQMHQSDLQWIRLALRTIFLVSGARTPQPGDSPESSECRAWIADQLQYYETAAQAQARRLQRITRTGGILAGAGGAISGLAVLLLLAINGVPLDRLSFLGIHASQWRLYGQWPNLAVGQTTLAAWAKYLMTVPPTLAGMLALLFGFYAQQRGFAENARQYERVFGVFDEARRRMQSNGDPKAILFDLGHEALSEHADWLILHRERPLRVVGAPITMQNAHG